MCPRVGRVSEAILPHHFTVRNRNWRRHLPGTRCCRTVMLMVSSICRFIQWYALLSLIYSMWTPIFPIDYLQPFFLNERHCCLPFSCFPFPFLTQVCSSITFKYKTMCGHTAPPKTNTYKITFMSQHICIYIYIHVYLHTHIIFHILSHLPVSIEINLFTNMHALQTYLHIHRYIHANMFLYA